MLSVQIGQCVLFHTSASHSGKIEQSKNVKGFSSFPHTLVFPYSHHDSYSQPFLLLEKKNDLHKQNNQTKESSFHVQKPKPVIISTPHPLSLCILRTTKQCLSPHVTFCSFPTCSGHTVLLSLTFFPVLTHRLHIHPHVPDDLTTPLLDSDTCPLELVKCAVPL